jgi:hypothetical protein
MYTRMPNRTSFWTASRVACAVALLFSAVYLAALLNRHWVPHDEGILSQSAERILQGQLPHRDFNEPYTGGLAYLDAAAFRIFGVKLISLRYLLFLFFLAWVPLVFDIANQLSSPWPAAAITLLAVVWSVPNYTAAMPSWYCLFFATFGVWSLLRFLRDPRPRWLILAGACGGLSFLMKSPGLFYVAGVMLFLIYREQYLSESAASTEASRSNRVLTAYFFFLLFGLLVFSFLLLKVIMTTGGSPEFFHFILPAFAIVVMLLVREFRSPHAPSLERLKSFTAMSLPFLLGLAAPLCMFFLWFWWQGGLHDLLNALFFLHARRVADARRAPPDAILAIFTIVWAVVLTEKSKRNSPLWASTCKVALAGVALLVCWRVHFPYFMVVESVWAAVPVLVLAGTIILLKLERREPRQALQRQQAMCLLCVTALWNLVQFPFSMPVYLCYVAPLTLLSLVAMLRFVKDPPVVNWKISGVFLFLFAVLLLRFSYVVELEFPTPANQIVSPLEVAPARGLLVSRDDAEAYNTLVPFVVARARGGEILAGPDCPEVYFLAGFQNHSRLLFEFLEDPQRYQLQTAALLRDHPAIKVAVVHQHPQFSLTHRNILTDLVRARFPMSRQIGDFIVYWN